MSEPAKDNVVPIAEGKKRTKKTTDFRPTDLAIAELFARAHQALVRHSEEWGWLVYERGCWRRATSGQVRRLLNQTLRGMWPMLKRCRDSEKRDELYRLLKRCETAQGQRSVLELAASEALLAVDARAFDAEPLLLNCTNGTLDLRGDAPVLRPHDPNDLLTKMTACAYDPDARSGLWERVLLEANAGNEETARFLQRFGGYSLTGLTTEEKLAALIGPGGSSKNTFTDAIVGVLGDYACTAGFDTFLRQVHNDRPREDLARFEGKRLVIANEAPKGAHLDEAVIKKLTGGDRVAVRQLYKGTFEYKPQFKLVLVANDAPRIDDSDSGMWRRVLRVPFESVVPPERRDPNVKATLTNTEKSGAAILAWMVRGYVEWRRIGLGTAQVIETATAAYQASQDPLAEFFAEHCTFEPAARCSRSELRRRYERWAKDAGGRFLLTPRSLGERLRLRGVTEGKSEGNRLWLGIGLREKPLEDQSLSELCGGDEPAPDGNLPRAATPSFPGQTTSGAGRGSGSPQLPQVPPRKGKFGGTRAPSCPAAPVTIRGRRPKGTSWVPCTNPTCTNRVASRDGEPVTCNWCGTRLGDDSAPSTQEPDFHV